MSKMTFLYRLLLILVLAVPSFNLLAQSRLNDGIFAKIDPVFHKHLFEEGEEIVALQLPDFVDSTAIEVNGTLFYRCKVMTSQPEVLVSDESLMTGSQWLGFVTARLSIEQMKTLAQREEVTYIEGAIKMKLFNDFARAVTGIRSLHEGNLNSTTYKGSGAMVAVVDAGIDWQHADFIDPSSSTTSRIYSLWDQELTANASEKTPQGNDATLTCCNFGVEYTNANINSELSSSNGDIRNADASSHGTHVAGTAVGNGNSLSPNEHIGMAPEADLVFINTDFSDASIIDALDYLDKKATDASKPIVVNLSLGSDFNAHDGTSLLAQAIDAFSGTGRIVVCAAGNEGEDNMHTSADIVEGGTSSFNITIPSYTANSGTGNDFVYLLVYLENSDSVTCQVDGPNGSSNSCAVNSTTHVNTTSDGAVYITNGVDARNSDRFFQIVLYDQVSTNTPAQGTYTITLTNVNASSPYSEDLTYHTWLYSKSDNSFALASGNNTYIVGSPASAKQAISVGAHVTRWRWHNYAGSSFNYSGTEESDDIAAFSSSGPLRDGTTKPEIAAPGKGIFSSLSTFSSAGTSRQAEGQKHFLNQGTSMACPVVSGAVALLLQANSSLSASDVKSLFTSNAVSDSHTGSVPNNSWGYGKLDALTAMAKAINGSATVSKEVIADDDWVSTSAVALSGSQLAAFKFSPSFNGQVESVYFHTGTTANSFSGDITVSIYDDNSGAPGSIVGSAFTIDDALVVPFSWHQAINTASLSVSSGSNYYVVLELANSGDSWSLLTENNSSSGNSLAFVSSSWFTQSFDFRIRPVIASATTVSLLPVELLYFQGEYSEKETAVHLTWATASEENNSHFMIERKHPTQNPEALWEPIGTVDGSGNSLSRLNYSFVDHDVLNKEFPLYYRLKQVDFNGKYTYSDVYTVHKRQTPETPSSLSIWPNPAAGNTLNTSQLDHYTIKGTDGKTWMQTGLTDRINIATLPVGTYMLVSSRGESNLFVVGER